MLSRSGGQKSENTGKVTSKDYHSIGAIDTWGERSKRKISLKECIDFFFMLVYIFINMIFKSLNMLFLSLFHFVSLFFIKNYQKLMMINKIKKVSSVSFNSKSYIYSTVCLPPRVRFPSITKYCLELPQKSVRIVFKQSIYMEGR